MRQNVLRDAHTHEEPPYCETHHEQIPNITYSIA